MTDQKAPTDRDVTLEIFRAYEAERQRPTTILVDARREQPSSLRIAGAVFVGILMFVVVLGVGVATLRLAGLDTAAIQRLGR